MTFKQWASFILMGLMWGSSFLWIKIGVRELGPFTLVAFRLVVAVLGYLVLVAVKKISIPKRGDLGKMAFLGLFNMVVPLVLISFSEQSIASGMVSVLNSTQPLFTALMAHFIFLEERLNHRKVLGLLLGFAGVVLLGISKLDGGGIHAPIIGVLAVLGAAFSYAISNVYTRKKFDSSSSREQAFGQTVFSALFIWPLAVGIESPIQLPQLPLTWVAIAYLGVIASTVTMMLFFTLIHQIGLNRTAQVSFLVALTGAVLGVVVLGEQLEWQLVAGGLMIIGGILIVNSQASNRTVSVSV